MYTFSHQQKTKEKIKRMKTGMIERDRRYITVHSIKIGCAKKNLDRFVNKMAMKGNKRKPAASMPRAN